MNAAITILDPLCKCIGVLESDSAPLSLAYACFVYIFVRLSDTETRFGLDKEDAEHVLQCLLYRWNRIYSPVHALAYFCDPYFFQMRDDVEKWTGTDALQLGKGSLRSQCRTALVDLADGNEELSTKLCNEFMQFSAKPHSSLSALKQHQPRLIWGQMTEVYPALAKKLMQVYMAPASTAGVERNHKTGKNILCARRASCGPGKIERQLAIAHNGHFLNREREARRAAVLRVGGFESIIASVASDAGDAINNQNGAGDDNEDRASDEEDETELLRLLASAQCPEEILDDDIFRNEDDD